MQLRTKRWELVISKVDGMCYMSLHTLLCLVSPSCEADIKKCNVQPQRMLVRTGMGREVAELYSEKQIFDICNYLAAKEAGLAKSVFKQMHRKGVRNYIYSRAGYFPSGDGYDKTNDPVMLELAMPSVVAEVSLV